MKSVLTHTQMGRVYEAERKARREAAIASNAETMYEMLLKMRRAGFLFRNDLFNEQVSQVQRDTMDLLDKINQESISP